MERLFSKRAIGAGRPDAVHTDEQAELKNLSAVQLHTNPEPRTMSGHRVPDITFVEKEEPIWQVYQQGDWNDFSQVLNSLIETAYTTDKQNSGLYMRPVTFARTDDFYIDFCLMQEIHVTRTTQHTWVIAPVRRDIRKSTRPATELIEQFLKFQIQALQLMMPRAAENDCGKLRLMCSRCCRWVDDDVKGIEPAQGCPLCSGKLIRGRSY